MSFIDCHSHSKNSPDSSENIIAMCEKAIELGLDAFAITDHCECNLFYPLEHYNIEPNGYDVFDYKRRFETSMIEINNIKEIYSGKLNILCGVELGQATFDLDVAQEIVSHKKLDVVIGSMHQVPDYADFAFLDYSKNDVKVLMQKYFEEIYKLCKWGQFDILGHLTYTLRYIEGNAGIAVDLSPYEELIRESFKELISKGKGIEINTSGLRQKYGKCFPELNYVKLFKDLGGEYLSIGSDAHCADDIGKGIGDGVEIAKAAGFSHLTYFKERKPNLIKID